VSVAPPNQLTPTEQDALVKQIGLAMLRVAPEDWVQLTVDYRAVGRYNEVSGEVVYSDDTADTWTLPPDLQGLFARLRAGMYREGRGTWFNARYRLDHPSSYNLEYDRDEPEWDLTPPPQAYPDDLRLFPRDEENIPEWLSRRLAAAPPAGPPPGPPGGAPRFRVARIFDGPGDDGRPSVNRPRVPGEDIGDLLDYLETAPLAGSPRGYDVDRLDAEAPSSVPVAFHTDGTWIWPAAVGYYLRLHDIAPEPDLVEHIRRQNFQVPPVDEQTRAAAAAFLGPPPGAPPRPGPPPGAPPARALPSPGGGTTQALAPPPPPRAPEVSNPPGPPPAALPSQGPPGQTLDQLRGKLAELNVPESAFRIGPPAGPAWTMEKTDDGWRVGWYDRAFVAPAMFEDVADASAFLLGKVMLDQNRRGAGGPDLPEPPDQFGTELSDALSAPVPPPPDVAAAMAAERPVPPPPPPPLPPPPPPPMPEPTTRREPIPEPPPRRALTPNGEWPIEPLAGEPPLTLFRGKEVIELTPGTEIDRFGDGDGNLVYAAGTPFKLRSLVPEWIDRPYHAYRVTRPFEAVTGTAIPWFDQPGGGTAFLLPDAVDDMLASGELVELPAEEPPV
jgi:nicrotizing toxin Mtb-like protein